METSAKKPRERKNFYFFFFIWFFRKKSSHVRWAKQTTSFFFHRAGESHGGIIQYYKLLWTKDVWVWLTRTKIFRVKARRCYLESGPLYKYPSFFLTLPWFCFTLSFFLIFFLCGVRRKIPLYLFSGSFFSPSLSFHWEISNEVGISCVGK